MTAPLVIESQYFILAQIDHFFLMSLQINDFSRSATSVDYPLVICDKKSLVGGRNSKKKTCNGCDHKNERPKKNTLKDLTNVSIEPLWSKHVSRFHNFPCAAVGDSSRPTFPKLMGTDAKWAAGKTHVCHQRALPELHSHVLGPDSGLENCRNVVERARTPAVGD